MKDLFDKVSLRCSKLTTQAYSTSFSLGIRCLDKKLRDPIYSIYGFVRFADEIVDTFHAFNKEQLLEKFCRETYEAIQDKISLNPILNSFQYTANHFGIEKALIAQFLTSMKMDLYKKNYDEACFKEYVFGSAEVVGLMCLRVFCNGNANLFDHLKPYAMSLGSAFQKVNFLRDLDDDYRTMGRVYFPGVDLEQFNETTKKRIEESIARDFHHAYTGIKQLPRSARFGVYIAYVYYLALFKKIRNTPSHVVLKGRIRIPNPYKAKLLAYSYFKHHLNLI
jgi:15-cis-phytoene synthase